MFKYKIFKIPENIKIDKKIVDNIFEVIWNEIQIVQNWELNIIFEDDKIIRELNREYREIDSTTDVLSFHYYTDFSKLKSTEIVWEIILSGDKIIKQAQEYDHSEVEEFYKLLIHSILHILWYDHENDEDYIQMKDEEDKIIEKIEKIYNIKIN